MATAPSSRFDRVAAHAALATLFCGVGALGWLAGHMLTYDATGRQHAHGSHGYMQSVEQGGSLVAALGVALAVLAVVLGRGAMSRWVARWRADGSPLPWIAAATTPATSFVLVELLEGSGRTGLDLFVVGVPLQAVIGLAVLAIVRSLLAVIVLVAECIATARRRTPQRGRRRAARPIVHIPARRVAPMATNAALRAPPVRRP